MKGPRTDYLQFIFLFQKTVTNENVTQVASDLAEVTNDTTNVNATGLEAIALTLESIVDVQSSSPEVSCKELLISPLY